MNRIDPAYCIRSRVALATAEYALKLQRHDVAEECYLTAYESDTTAVNYLRALLNCADSEKRNQRLKKIPAFKPANMTAYYSLSSSSGELKKNVLSDPMYYTLKFFQGSFIDVLHKGLNNKEALGWTGTFMKPGLALYMLLLYKGSKDIRGILQMVEIAREAVGFSREQFENGLMEKTSEKDASLFFKCFQKWKQSVVLSENDQVEILQWLEKKIEMRVDGIMAKNHRKYYGECAAFIAAFGEVKESRGEYGGKQSYMTYFKNKYYRRTAFKGELQRFGWNG